MNIRRNEKAVRATALLRRGFIAAAASTLILGVCVLANGISSAQDQQNQNPPAQDQIPDAPSSVRPIPPPEPPSPRAEAEQGQADNAEGESSSKESASEPPHSATDLPAANSDQAPPPMPEIKTVPAGSVPKDKDTGEDLYKIIVTPNLVQVPVLVKDSDGRMVNGLLSKDFSVYENGVKQQMKFFTSDPYALSAAVVIDLGMPDEGVKKLQATLSALQGAFTPYDEVGIYTYSTTAGRLSDFGGVGKHMTLVLNEIKTYSGANNGVPVTSGPLAQGPIINGMPVDQPVVPVSTPPRVSHVLNDAILMAARDLAKRDPARRKIIFVISDGRELGSTASYKDTLKVLQTQQIIVYAIGLEGAATPVYGKIEHIHLPKSTALLGYSDILPKYVSATGGGTVYNETTSAAIERAYIAALGEARNQYTIGYSSKGIGGYREIEVRVRGSKDYKVYAKQGYYPLPAPR